MKNDDESSTTFIIKRVAFDRIAKRQTVNWFIKSKMNDTTNGTTGQQILTFLSFWYDEQIDILSIRWTVWTMDMIKVMQISKRQRVACKNIHFNSFRNQLLI